MSELKKYCVKLSRKMIVLSESMETASMKARGILADEIEEKGVSVTTMKELFKSTVQE